MNRRVLKKKIKEAFEIIYNDLAFYIQFVDGADREQAIKLFMSIPAIEEDLISKISVNEGKEVKGRVKKYYNSLIEEVNTKINNLADEIAALP